MDIQNYLQVGVTVVSNEFIDHYMAAASGEYVKEYLYLLRHMGENPRVSDIADALNRTESDVIRALNYWEKAGVLSAGARDAVLNSESFSISEEKTLEGGGDVQAKAGWKAPAGDGLTAAKEEGESSVGQAVVRPFYTSDQVNRLAGDEDFSQLLYIAQKYMNKIFTQRDCEVFAYLYDGLRIPVELLEYVVEYCVQGGHSNLRYIETVALKWHESGIRTVEEAKEKSALCSKDTFSVMKAFGLNDRKPGDSEREMIDKWFKFYGFTREIVLEACRRTLAAIHSPSFQYADKILTQWKKSGVKTAEDIRRLDERWSGGRQAADESQGKLMKNRKNQFHNFRQRETDYDELILQRLREE